MVVPIEDSKVSLAEFRKDASEAIAAAKKKKKKKDLKSQKDKIKSLMKEKYKYVNIFICDAAKVQCNFYWFEN